jgi:hypothetical protein
MIKLHVTDGMIDSSNSAGITHGALDPRFFDPVREKASAMNASKSDLVELDWLLPTWGRLRKLRGRRSEDFDLFSDKDVERAKVLLVFILC